MRVYLLSIPALVALTLDLACQLALASSSAPLPLAHIEHPSTLRLEILPRNARRHGYLQMSIPSSNTPALHPTDSIRLTLSAFSRTFHLHLQPNYDLLHPHAQIHHVRTDEAGRSEVHLSASLFDHTPLLYHGEVIHEEHTLQRLREDAAGGIKRLHPHVTGSEGWARIVLHDQGDWSRDLPPTFEGAFSVEGVVHHVVTMDNYLRTRLAEDPLPEDLDTLDNGLVIYRDSDLVTRGMEESDLAQSPTCSHDRLQFNSDLDQNPVRRLGTGLDHARMVWNSPFWTNDPTLDFDLGADIRRRGDISGNNVSSNFIDDIGDTKHCSKSEKILYIGVAADCAYTAFYGSVQNATSNILKNFNIVSALYKSTFNVSIGLIELQVQEPTCPNTPDPDRAWNAACGNITLDQRLSLFSQWRGEKGGGDGAGLWHLMTGCPTGTEIGVAWLGTLCDVDASGTGDNVVSGTAVTSATRTEWGVIAHEIGHNFGAIHDCTSNCTLSDGCCPLTSNSCDSSQNFLMSPVSQSKQSVFSQCTIGNICTAMSTMNTTCLQSTSDLRKTLSLQMCGNGIVEEGEDCDPGLGSNSTCCTSSCKFASGAKCDPLSSDCCTSSCQFAPSTQVCRPAKDASCDTAEMCSGVNATCPVDHTKLDGTSCGVGLTCASGACTSPDQQCQTFGTSMNLTKACGLTGDKSCSVTCQDPKDPSQCVVLQTMLIDGSKCGYGGHCYHGDCMRGSIFDTAKAWVTSNKSLSIPILVVGGALVLLLIWTVLLSCIRHCCCTRQRKDQDRRMQPPAGPFVMNGHGNGGGSMDKTMLNDVVDSEKVTPVLPSGPVPIPVLPPAAYASGFRRGGSRSSGSSGSSAHSGLPPSLRAGGGPR